MAAKPTAVHIPKKKAPTGEELAALVNRKRAAEPSDAAPARDVRPRNTFMKSLSAAEVDRERLRITEDCELLRGI